MDDYTNYNNYGPGPRHSGRSGGRRPGRLKKLLWLIPLAIFLLVAAFDSFYTLKEDQYAVITTFGKPTTVSASGLQFKIPFVQRVYKVSKSVQSFPLGYRTGSNESVDSESLMITYDYNFVNVDFYVEYRVTDPVKYLYNSNDPVGILKMLCQSYIRDTIGLYDVDSVITTGKSEIQADIKQKIVERLETEDLGIQLTNITIQDAEPPTPEVQQRQEVRQRGHARRQRRRRRDRQAGGGLPREQDQRGQRSGGAFRGAFQRISEISPYHKAAAVL